MHCYGLHSNYLLHAYMLSLSNNHLSCNLVFYRFILVENSIIINVSDRKRLIITETEMFLIYVCTGRCFTYN